MYKKPVHIASNNNSAFTLSSTDHNSALKKSSSSLSTVISSGPIEHSSSRSPLSSCDPHFPSQLSSCLPKPSSHLSLSSTTFAILCHIHCYYQLPSLTDICPWS